MNKLRYIILILILFLSSILYAAVLDDARVFERVYLKSAIKVEAIPTNIVGTGFFTKLEREPAKFIFTTNKHVIDGADSLKLTIPITDTSDAIIKTLTIMVPLSKKIVKYYHDFEKKDIVLQHIYTIELHTDTVEQYYFPEEGFDIALVIVDKQLISQADSKSETLRVFAIPYSSYVSIDNLFVGQSVVFTGYPLGLSINRIQPLLKKGAIAGVDTIKNVIYLDADALGGSSGSPVFIDFNTQANVEFWDAYKQMLVGIISGYLTFERRRFNNQTGKFEVVQIGNSGIAVVVPAETIKKVAERLLSGSK